MKLRHSISFLALAIALSAAVAPARADAPADAVYRVSVRDLDLRSADAVNVLYDRLTAAAHAVCGLETAGYFSRDRARSCVIATLDAVVAEVAPGTALSARLKATHRAARGRVWTPVPVARLARE